MGKKLCLCLFLMIVLILDVQESSCKAFMKIHFIDVGFGDAIFIQSPDGKNILIDSGPEGSSEKVVAYLRSLQVAHIDVFVLTHPHRDHFGGLPFLLDHFSIGELYSNGETDFYHEGFLDVLEKIREKEYSMKKVKKGDRFSFFSDQIVLDILSPGEFLSHANDNAIVFQLSFGNTSFLFTSDIDVNRQKELRFEEGQWASIDAVQIPHHGGDLVSDFVGRFKDKILVLSIGSNPYGLPQEKNLQSFDKKIYRTDIDGTVILVSDGKEVNIVTP